MPRKKSTPARQDVVERRIHFYRVRTQNGQDGKPAIVDPTATLQAINALPFTSDGRYLPDKLGDVLVCWPESLKSPQRLIFGKSRRYNLPQEELGGKRKALRIDPASGLSEVCHIIWFPDNYLGAEFNFYGPRISRLHTYLTLKAKPPYSAEGFELLIKKDALEELNRLDELRVFSTRVHRSYTDLFAQANKSLSDALTAQMDAIDADEIELTLKVARKTRHPLAASLFRGLRRLARRADLHEKVDKLWVKGPSQISGKLEEVDLLKDELVVTKSILRLDPRGRSVQAESAFAEIEAAYQEVKGLLPLAASVTD
jgi:hypothetical protein